ncbi:hypothetical protein DFH07DRAFT_574174 [Mycena maculata]|uniref:Stealth protein CR3 conserved region 3 domain-containing protein n=1 Tax=Mycena maculata TaxID=230809 RepID=A0AAD7IPW6_9AGAR|nr:hypothetical protein DFH07DRAFT_574174 [Mycena maculata]
MFSLRFLPPGSMMKLAFSTRKSFLYRPLGGNAHFRNLLFNRFRFIAVFLIVLSSLTTISFIIIQQPYESELDIPTSPLAIPPVPPEPSAPEIAPPVPEFVGSSVYHPFVLPPSSKYLADQTVRSIKAHKSISDECLDRWVATGQWEAPCTENMVDDAMIDLVYTWVNGSDPLHEKARMELEGATNYNPAEARFREHDELRYSLRAAHDATAGWLDTIVHIVTPDVPHPDTETQDALNTTSADQRRLGLVPQWLDIRRAFNGSDGEPPIILHHDSQVFRLTGRPGATLTPADATDWLGKVLPSFNSHAIESQLAHLDPGMVADNIVALNDDQFLMMPLPPSAFHSTLYGPVFRMQSNFRVGGDASGNADGGGEWRSLGWASHLMSQRFGDRKRPYMQHNARALSLPLMHEMSLAFGSYFAATPLSQFRGSHNASEELEVNTIFMATHYVIERHREALLWSWVVAKWGGRLGVLDRDQKKRMWRELGGREGDTLQLQQEAKRSTKADIDFNLWMAGVQSPTSPNSQVMGNTIYSWVSMDGFSASFLKLADVTTIKRRECIGEETELAWDMFLRLAQKDITCGDDVIATLMHASPSGLSVFLPPPSTQPSSDLDPIILPLEMPAEAPPLPPNPRAFAVRLFMRYAYVIGSSTQSFITPKSARQAATLLGNVSRRKDVLMCINDDLVDNQVVAGDKVMRDWFRRRWPNKLQYEM